MADQYARVKNVEKGKRVIKDNNDQTYFFDDEFLEEAMKSSIIYEIDEHLDYENWSSNHNDHATLSILDGGTDTFILGQRWKFFLFIAPERQI
jgi:hypothetical protein